MQFTTIALTLAAAAAASAAATATVEVYNLSKCQEEAKADSFELQEVGDCVNFGQGYGAASWIKGEEAGDVLVAVFDNENCSGNVTVTGSTGCAENTSGNPILSAGLIQDPTGHA